MSWQSRSADIIILDHTVLAVNTSILLSLLSVSPSLMESPCWMVIILLPVTVELNGLATSSFPQLTGALRTDLSFILKRCAQLCWTCISCSPLHSIMISQSSPSLESPPWCSGHHLLSCAILPQKLVSFPSLGLLSPIFCLLFKSSMFIVVLYMLAHCDHGPPNLYPRKAAMQRSCGNMPSVIMFLPLSPSINATSLALLPPPEVYSTMPNQWKPTCMYTICLIPAITWYWTLIPVPKGDIEPHAWEYHSWGVLHSKLLRLLENHFDTKKFGLGYMLFILFTGPTNDLYSEVPRSRNGFVTGV